MSFSSRDQYRHVVEQLARATGLSEEEVARKAVAAASAAAQAVPRAEQKPDVRQCHVGYYLFAPGRSLLEKAIGYRARGMDAVVELAARGPLACYLGATATIWCLTVGGAAAVAWELGARGSVPGWQWS